MDKQLKLDDSLIWTLIIISLLLVELDSEIVYFFWVPDPKLDWIEENKRGRVARGRVRAQKEAREILIVEIYIKWVHFEDNIQKHSHTLIKKRQITNWREKELAMKDNNAKQ